MNEKKYAELVENNDKLREKINEVLEPHGLRIHINNGTKWARSVCFYKGGDFVKSCILADEEDLNGFLWAMRETLDFLY